MTIYLTGPVPADVHRRAVQAAAAARAALDDTLDALSAAQTVAEIAAARGRSKRQQTRSLQRWNGGCGF